MRIIGKVYVRNPKEVYLRLKGDYKNPVFLEGFLYGGLFISIFGLIVTLV